MYNACHRARARANKPPEISDEINSIADIDIANLQPSNLNGHKLNEYIVSGNLKKISC